MGVTAPGAVTAGKGDSSMDVAEQIEGCIAGQAEPKRDEMRALHRLILGIAPASRLWYLDGRDESGKVVSNPNIGYGSQLIHYAGGKTREFYRIGLSGNTTGISIYVMGIEDKKYLAETYGERLGKASVTGYCIKFRALGDIDIDVLEEIIRFGLLK
ncbi:DUF1801 domain-containing protein [Sphingomonas sp. LB-2]|uniref:DUF1801 domain-containing protein n=1 Tax=Sphingomonas caeni TaxID=2984949 RepID=UPI0022301B15|nr:DUF1801 domain-containing protein [Sphingomonas caeni]MCW3846140.1 DUF1801 domain-containing protein [Sphingomonas caeni]